MDEKQFFTRSYQMKHKFKNDMLAFNSTKAVVVLGEQETTVKKRREIVQKSA